MSIYISLIENRKVTLCPLNDIKFLLSIFNLKPLLGITTYVSIINDCTPPRNFSKYLKPGLTSIVKLCFVSDLLP